MRTIQEKSCSLNYSTQLYYHYELKSLEMKSRQLRFLTKKKKMILDKKNHFRKTEASLRIRGPDNWERARSHARKNVFAFMRVSTTSQAF